MLFFSRETMFFHQTVINGKNRDKKALKFNDLTLLVRASPELLFLQVIDIYKIDFA